MKDKKESLFSNETARGLYNTFVLISAILALSVFGASMYTLYYGLLLSCL